MVRYQVQPVLWEEILRRVMDIGAALCGLIVLSPLLLFLAIQIKRDSPGPILYRAPRVGKDGRLFELYKFRSMVVDAAQRGPAITTADDARITRIGHFLRRTKLDELPQLFNVLKGDMSLVGPRPEDPRYVALYTPAQREILKTRPGMTGAASFAYREEEHMLAGENWDVIYRNQILPAKLAIDLEYSAHRTLRSDLQLIMRTVHALVARSGQNA